MWDRYWALGKNTLLVAAASVDLRQNIQIHAREPPLPSNNHMATSSTKDLQSSQRKEVLSNLCLRKICITFKCEPL